MDGIPVQEWLAGRRYPQVEASLDFELRSVALSYNMTMQEFSALPYLERVKAVAHRRVSSLLNAAIQIAQGDS